MTLAPVDLGELPMETTREFDVASLSEVGRLRLQSHSPSQDFDPRIHPQFPNHQLFGSSKKV
jgi:hypothetical protein